VLKLLHNKLKEFQMNGVRPDAAQGPALDLVRRDQDPDDLDCRINALVVLGRVLQFAAAVTGVVFAYCLLTVSTLYLLAEVIPMILWAVGSEIQNVRAAYDGSLYFPGYSNPPFMQNQPIGIPNRNNSCGPSSIVQLSLVSPAFNAALDQHPDHPLAHIRGQYRAVQAGQRRVGQEIRPEVLRQNVSAENRLDAGAVFGQLLQNLLEQNLILLGLPPLQPNDDAQELFYRQLLQEYPNPSGALELFIHVPSVGRRPIPFAFEHNGNRFEADAFILHTPGGGGHYTAFVRKEHPEVQDPIWWRTNDSRVTALDAPPQRELERAVIVHYRRTNAEV
jgi:hypothetical protein